MSFSLANQGLTSDVAFGQFRTDSDTGIGSISLRTGSLVKLTHFPAGVSGTGWMAVDGSWLVWEQSESNVDPTNWTLRALNLVSSEQLILTRSTKLAGGLFQMGQSPVPVISNGVVAWGEPTASPDNSPRSKVVLYNLTSRQAMTIDAGIVSSPVFAGDKLVWAKIDPTTHAYSFAAVRSDTLASVDVSTLFPKPDSIVNLAGSGEYLAWTPLLESMNEEGIVHLKKTIELRGGQPETDASLAEVNPLIVAGDGRVIALDAKLNFDSNALYRHPEIVAMRDLDEEDPAEIEASKFDLSYISLDGNIGCLVNGAGLAMATMDTIKLFGATPANFLDVGGGATTEKVTEAFKIMLGNPKVKGILVNIFGGIMRCDTIANGIVAAAHETHLAVPLVVRMKGTNEELGRQILKDSGLPIIAADNMADAAQKIVAAVAGK